MDSLTEIIGFLNGAHVVSFEAEIGTRVETYRWIEDVLVKFSYALAGKRDRGIIRLYIQKMTGYSRAQVTRCIGSYLKTGRVRVKEYTRNSFVRTYTDGDIKLLAETDELHEFPNGCALKKTLERMVNVYRAKEYERIANISVTHIYTLRRSIVYQRITKHYEKTKPNVVNIGERRKPEPNGKPGYVRIDSVHQGDQPDGKGKYMKGVYHINIVDEITQGEFVMAVEKISEAYLLPLLEELIDCFAFVIKEFHADNGSEYINHQVAAMLNRLLIKLTKNRSRHCTDNALAESKNKAIIRKWMGYGYIAQKHANRINQFYKLFNEYINYHRVCAFPSEIADKKRPGKIKKIYKQEDYMTPYQKLKSLENAQQYLKPGITFAQLDTIAMRYTDNEMARKVQEERGRLFDDIILTK
jgi:transposase InsO family protein